MKNKFPTIKKFYFNITLDISPRIAERTVTLYKGSTKLPATCVLGYDAVWRNRLVTNYSTLKTEERRVKFHRLSRTCLPNCTVSPEYKWSNRLKYRSENCHSSTYGLRKNDRCRGYLGGEMWRLNTRNANSTPHCRRSPSVDLLSVLSYLRRLSFQRSIRTGQMEFSICCDPHKIRIQPVTVLWNILRL